VAAYVAVNLDGEAARRGRPIEAGEVEMATWGMYLRGKAVSAPAYVRALQTVHAFGRAAAALWDRYDVLLTSTLGTPAIPIGALRGPKLSLDGYVERLFDFMPNTQAFNHSGQPAMTVPLAWSKGGLPIGIQFAGRYADEALLFRLAGQLEAARPWAHLRPPAFS
jgi:Asp-tRNA(Asn)/Glu-tRNA(Gln) amidotransferase A subunit family amidase